MIIHRWHKDSVTVFLSLAYDRAHVRRTQARAAKLGSPPDRFARAHALRRSGVWLKGEPPRRLFYTSLQSGDLVTLSVNCRYSNTRKSLIVISQSNDSTSNWKHRDIEVTLACRHQDKPCSGCENSDINQFDRPWQETVKANLSPNVPNGLITKLPWLGSFSLLSSSSPSSSSTWQNQNIMLINHAFNTKTKWSPGSGLLCYPNRYRVQFCSWVERDKS